MAVGDNIRRLRLGAGMTQDQLAQRLGVARSTITQWERGWTQLRMGMVHKLALVFGTTDSTIVSEDPSQDEMRAERVPEPIPAVIPIDSGEDGMGENDTERIRRVGIQTSVFWRHRHARAVIVSDNAMSRVLPQGMVAVYDPNMLPRNGQVVVIASDGRLLIRRWFRGSNTVMLVADSHELFEDMLLAADSVEEVLGVVVWGQFIRELG